jgi:hypothetical protein
MDARRVFKSLDVALAIVAPGLVALVFGWFVVVQSETMLRAQAPAPAQTKPPDEPTGNPPANPNFDSGEVKTVARPVPAALYWLARHQMPEGNWSLIDYRRMCKDKSCTGAAAIESLSAATALGLLPFLAADQKQSKNGPYRKVIDAGLKWLLNHQKADGDLSAGAASQMYSHGLATIALCKDYGLTRDKAVAAAAQKAIDFIQDAQNSTTGAWRYHPGEEGDTSVLGWQLTALKNAEQAGLTVKPIAFDGAKKWLKSCGAGGDNLGTFSYQPEGGPTPTMTAVALLCNQYLHMDHADPVITGGVKYLMANQPDVAKHNIYYWYYATQVMHNRADKDWDTWNRKIRPILVESQMREGCAAGSWDPEKPDKDAWGPMGGRIMTTSLSCLTLEVYYSGYLPLYKLDKPQSEPSSDPEQK